MVKLWVSYVSNSQIFYLLQKNIIKNCKRHSIKYTTLSTTTPLSSHHFQDFSYLLLHPPPYSVFVFPDPPS